ncbi:hypothetical protein [Actinomadura harenae]|uniref:RiboL-PSP-HEPN domain-containing protein n=1 Tax=Actinomadura harenae TaxID=2483351 RepID=A0A3M2LS97_9ACTN|nr:hypothetical protein [Actinomadura harenae]RMI39443.1 hypothetical protein EBO15_29685 [Actinomadura harenae]
MNTNKFPFKRFTDNIQYAQRMINGGLTLETLGASGVDLGTLTSDHAPHPDDLYRAAWTQATTALDHWLHEAIIDYIVAHTDDTTWERPKGLNALKMDFGHAEELSGPRQKRIVIQEFLRKELNRSTYQRSAVISDGLRLAVHLNGGQIWASIGAPCNMSANEAISWHDAIVDRRNKIAHRADLDDQGRRTPMSAAEAQGTLDWITHVGSEVALLLH